MFRDRIKSLRRVRAGDLRANPKNWRQHSTAQSDALRGILEEVGFADAILARQDGDSLEIIDGHLRADLDPEAKVPVLILDVSEAEAAKLLAVIDPIAGMATADPAKLDALLREIDTGSEALSAMLAELAKDNGLYDVNGSDGSATDSQTLADRFIVPPFSVLDARQGYWQDRKRAWLSLGIQSEIGRGGGVHDYSDAATIKRQGGTIGQAGGYERERERDGKQNGYAQRSDAEEVRICPGGSPRPAMKLSNGKTVRGDGAGRPLKKPRKAQG